MVIDRLPGLVPWNVGPNSIQFGSAGDFTVAKRMPSGRVGDSIFSTSAPRVARRWVAAGPAQNAVRSSTVMPVEGECRVRRTRVSRPRPRPAPAVERVAATRARTADVSAPSSGAAATGATGDVGEVERGAGLAEPGRVLDEHLPRREVVHLEHRPAVAHERDGNAEQSAELEDLGRVVRFQPRTYDRLRELAVAAAALPWN